ncbi:MAG: J domain-containing protein [Pyrinomonadaceae bacterium]|nr:J domain-containing protein [Pyrinomonadaceae bacterium]
MPDYYKILDVSSKASAAEIKSAYRRLARKKHPDVNDGDEKLAQEFSAIAEAYNILGDPHERAEYDKRILRAEFYSSNGEDSVFNSDNPHARRMRQMAYEKRYNAIIDRMIADERRESMALQKIIFPVVALFVSTGFVATFKPLFWSNSSTLGKLVLLGLFIGGLLHLLKRLAQGFERYTYSSNNIHDSLLDGIDEETRPYSRFAAMSFLIAGIAISLGIGLILGNSLEFFTTAMMPRMFSHSLHPEFIFYPPIVVLLVDFMHSLAIRFEL